MDVRELVTREEVEERFVKFAARKVAHQYSRYGVTYEDCKSEILVWYYSDTGQKNITRWLEHEPQQTSRIRYTFLDKARHYAETEKATKCGYDPDDLQWYSASLVEALLPLALDVTYDGTGPLDFERADSGPAGRAKRDPAESNDILAMVVDVRRALDDLGDWVRDGVRNYPPGIPFYDSAIEAIVQYLGGPRPRVGDRRVKSNAQAQAETRSQTGE